MTKKLSSATVAAQAAGYVDTATGGVVPPIQPSTTYVRDADYALMRPDNIYARDDSDIVRVAEGVLARLEHATETRLFPSGMAAIAAVFRGLPHGARVIVQSGIYWGTTAWTRDFCARRGVELKEVDAADPGQLEEAIGAHHPDLIFIETPSNPWLKTTDIAEAAQMAKRADALLVVDSTAATPILTQPLDLGADIVMHSATKGIGGHSDVMAGALAVKDTDLPIWQAIKTDRHDAGSILGPFEAWLLVRSIRTLPLRVERMSENALAVARAMEADSRIEAVFYPGLPSHPGHDIAKRQMSGGFGSLLSICVKGGFDAAKSTAGKLALFHRATSLGGVESLVEHRHVIEPHTGIPENLLRISVGIEDVSDLLADLDQALG